MKKNRRTLRFLLRLNKEERNVLEQLSKQFSRPLNEVACIAISFLLREIQKQEAPAKLTFLAGSTLPDIHLANSQSVHSHTQNISLS